MPRTEKATLVLIRDFLASHAFAVVGASANERKFGNAVFREMRQRRLTVVPVNPHRETIEGVQCYATVLDLPAHVDAVVTVVPPGATATVVEQCAQRGIRKVWMQPGSSSGEVVRTARERGMAVVAGECILMHIEPVTSIHAFHRWVRRLVGRYPR